MNHVAMLCEPHTDQEFDNNILRTHTAAGEYAVPTGSSSKLDAGIIA